MKTVLVIGASRGIGLEFVRQHVAAGDKVFATHRTEDDRIKLRDMGANTLKLDVMNVSDIAGLAWQLDGEKMDVAIVNAGVYGPRTSTVLQSPTDEEFDNVMRTNVLAIMRLVPIVAPLLEPARGTLAFISSKMGSISNAWASYGMLYRTSKVALNMVAKLAHTDFSARGVRVLTLHPGWVRTDMGGPNAEIDVKESIDGMRRVIADDTNFASGGFYDFRGASIDW
jgi:NAD(P)-dependent dehydrogenase (short-subunit alcohol dehydrogenase family)